MTRRLTFRYLLLKTAFQVFVLTGLVLCLLLLANLHGTAHYDFLIG